MHGRQKRKGNEMKIRIDGENEKKIKDLLNEKQKGCTARILYYENLLYFAKKAEMHLNTYFVTKSERIGSKYEYCEGVRCNSYKYRAAATRVILERGSKAWYLTACHRSQTNTNRGSRDDWFMASPRSIESAHKRIEILLEKI